MAFTTGGRFLAGTPCPRANNV